MRRFRLLFMFSLMFCLIVYSQSFAASRDLLRLYSALDPNEAKVYIDAFTKDTKINVEWVRLSAGEVLTRLKAESKNPQVSLWLGGPSIEHIAAKKAGLLQRYNSPAAKFVPANARDAEYYWTGSSFGAIGFASNTTLFQKNGWQYPTSWQDLLKPEFKNNVSLAYPYTSGTSFLILAALVQMMGEDQAMDYWKKLDQNVHHYNTSGSACVTQVGLGEVAVGISFSHDIMTKGKDKGYPVKMTFPKEGTAYEIGCVSLIKGGKEPRQAKKFFDWIFSVRAQNLLQIWNRIPLNPAAEVAPDSVKASDVKLINFDDELAGNQQARLIERWRKTIGK